MLRVLRRNLISELYYVKVSRLNPLKSLIRWKAHNTTQQIMNKFVCAEKNQRFLLYFGALSPNQFLDLPSTSGSWDNPQWIFQKHWKCPLWVAWERDHKVFYGNPSIRGFFGFKFSFQNCFWNVFSTSGLSQICKIRNVWKRPSPFSWNTLIPCSEKTSWSLKTSFWKENCQINSKTVIKNFFHVRFPGKNLWTSWFWHILAKNLKTMEILFAWKIVMTVFKFDG
jgi:hypothetical protein